MGLIEDLGWASELLRPGMRPAGACWDARRRLYVSDMIRINSDPDIGAGVRRRCGGAAVSG